MYLVAIPLDSSSILIVLNDDCEIVEKNEVDFNEDFTLKNPEIIHNFLNSYDNLFTSVLSFDKYFLLQHYYQINQLTQILSEQSECMMHFGLSILPNGLRNVCFEEQARAVAVKLSFKLNLLKGDSHV